MKVSPETQSALNEAFAKMASAPIGAMPAQLERLEAIRMATAVAAKTGQDAIYLANKYMEWANKA